MHFTLGVGINEEYRSRHRSNTATVRKHNHTLLESASVAPAQESHLYLSSYKGLSTVAFYPTSSSGIIFVLSQQIVMIIEKTERQRVVLTSPVMRLSVVVILTTYLGSRETLKGARLCVISCQSLNIHIYLLLQCHQIQVSPPPYDSSTSPPPNASLSITPTSSAPKEQPDVPINPPLSNYVALDKRDGGVKGVWYIDPSLSVPESLLPPLESEESSARKNLMVRTHNGNITAEIYLLGKGDERALMEVGSHNGGVTVKVVRLFLSLYLAS